MKEHNVDTRSPDDFVGLLVSKSLSCAGTDHINCDEKKA